MALLSRVVRWLICCFMFSLSSVIFPFELFYFPFTLFFRSTSAGCSLHNCRFGKVKAVCGGIIGETGGEVLRLPSLPSLTLPVGVLPSGPLSLLGNRGWKPQREASALTQSFTSVWCCLLVFITPALPSWCSSGHSTSQRSPMTLGQLQQYRYPLFQR